MVPTLLIYRGYTFEYDSYDQMLEWKKWLKNLWLNIYYKPYLSLGKIIQPHKNIS